MPQAERQGQAQGAGDAATSEQGTGANQPQTAPAPDLDDLADVEQELQEDSTGYTKMCPDVSTHLTPLHWHHQQHNTYIRLCVYN